MRAGEEALHGFELAVRCERYALHAHKSRFIDGYFNVESRELYEFCNSVSSYHTKATSGVDILFSAT